MKKKSKFCDCVPHIGKRLTEPFNHLSLCNTCKRISKPEWEKKQ